MNEIMGSSAPDLLSRFVSTPHSGVFHLKRLTLSVETNDSTLLQLFGKMATNSSEPKFSLKILRDRELDLHPSRPTILESETNSVVAFGRAAILAFDRPHRRFFAVVSQGASDDWLRTVFVSTIHEFCLEASLLYRNSGSIRAKIHQHASSMYTATKG